MKRRIPSFGCAAIAAMRRRICVLFFNGQMERRRGSLPRPALCITLLFLSYPSSIPATGILILQVDPFLIALARFDDFFQENHAPQAVFGIGKIQPFRFGRLPVQAGIEA